MTSGVLTTSQNVGATLSKQCQLCLGIGCWGLWKGAHSPHMSQMESREDRKLLRLLVFCSISPHPSPTEGHPILLAVLRYQRLTQLPLCPHSHSCSWSCCFLDFTCLALGLGRGTNAVQTTWLLMAGWCAACA